MYNFFDLLLLCQEYGGVSFKCPSKHLRTDLVVLLSNSLLCEVESARVVLVVTLVLNGHLAELGDDVLHECVGLGALLAAQVVKRGHARHDVVDNGNDNDDSNGVAPHDHNGDDVGATIGRQGGGQRGWGGLLACTAGEPTKDTEEGGEDIDTENGQNKLEGGVGLEATGDKDEPVLSKRDLQEENTLDGTVVLNDTTVGEPKGATEDPGAHGEEGTQNDGDDPDLGQLPLDGTTLKVGVIVGDGDGSKISEQSEEYNQVDTDGLVDGNHGRDKVKLQVQAKSDTVLDIGLHTLENLAGDLDSGDNGRKTRGKEDDISGGLSGLSGTLDGDTTVGLLQGGSVVDTITSHCTAKGSH